MAEMWARDATDFAGTRRKAVTERGRTEAQP